jgi:hypothetical protein
VAAARRAGERRSVRGGEGRVSRRERREVRARAEERGEEERRTRNCRFLRVVEISWSLQSSSEKLFCLDRSWCETTRENECDWCARGRKREKAICSTTTMKDTAVRRIRTMHTNQRTFESGRGQLTVR